MYRHLLVPIDGSELSVNAISRAIEFAGALGARVTFFHARPSYSAAAEKRGLLPKDFAEESARAARAILSKAEVAAREASVPHDSLSKTSNSPYEAIIETAEERSCDLIFMPSHGQRGIRGLMLGSQTQKVLMHTRIAVLIPSVESNDETRSLNTAIAIIKDEHRSIAAVIHGLQYVVRQAREGNAKPEFRLLRAMLYYIKAFPEALHHPKEDEYVFSKLRVRTHEVDDAIADLKRQHVEGHQLIGELERTLDLYEADASSGLDEFAQALEQFAEAQWHHMSLEEKIILPAGQRHLTPDDWADIAEAFCKNGDPRFVADPDEHFRKLFSRIMSMVPERSPTSHRRRFKTCNEPPSECYSLGIGDKVSGCNELMVAEIRAQPSQQPVECALIIGDGCSPFACCERLAVHVHRSTRRSADSIHNAACDSAWIAGRIQFEQGKANAG